MRAVPSFAYRCSFPVGIFLPFSVLISLPAHP